MKSWTRMTAQIARKTYQIENEIFLFIDTQSYSNCRRNCQGYRGGAQGRRGPTLQSPVAPRFHGGREFDGVPRPPGAGKNSRGSHRLRAARAGDDSNGHLAPVVGEGG